MTTSLLARFAWKNLFQARGVPDLRVATCSTSPVGKAVQPTRTSPPEEVRVARVPTAEEVEGGKGGEGWKEGEGGEGGKGGEGVQI